MSFTQIFVLSFIQGVTEFLPVSSSGHLAILAPLTGWKDQGLFTDVLLHVGTLGAIFTYFWKDIISLFKGVFHLFNRKETHERKLLMALVIGTIPAVIVGLLIQSLGLKNRDVTLIAINLVIFGLLLGLADRAGSHHLRRSDMTLVRALMVGFGQAAALFPGVSRSGGCLTMLRLMGFDRETGTRFTFLLAIPAIIAAATLTGYNAYKDGSQFDLFSETNLLLVGLSFIFGLLAIWGMLRIVRRRCLTPFVVYRLVLGTCLYLWAKGYAFTSLLPNLPIS